MREKIKESMIHLCKNLLEWDIKDEWDKLENEQFFGNIINMKVYDLLYLFFEIEDHFGVKIPERYIANGKFVSLRNVVNFIYDQKINQI